MKSDSIKLLFSNLIALIIVAGGGYILWTTYGDPNATNLQVMTAGFMGYAINYVFQSENQTRTARLQEKALMTGTGNGYGTVTYSNSPNVAGNAPPPHEPPMDT